MKPIITQSDYNTLKTMLEDIPHYLRQREFSDLQSKIENAVKVKDSLMDKDMIRLNTAFLVEDMNACKEMKFILTLPEMMNLSEGKLSVLSPLGIAVLGYEEGRTIECRMPGGWKKLKIIKVIGLVI